MDAYDVFLSHASDDKPTIRELARRLREAGLKPFLDESDMVPGEDAQEALEDAFDKSSSCAVFLGKELGRWQNEEMRAALEKRTRVRSFRVIPVLLPGARNPDDLPLLLRRPTWIDMRRGIDDDAVHRLVRGVRGKSPGASESVDAPAVLYRAKLPPRDFFVHRSELDDLRTLLTDADASTVGITTALRGAGGFG